MIKGATTFINKFTGETKQKCVCDSVHPIHHKVCFSCGRGQKIKSNYQEKFDKFMGKDKINEFWNAIEGVNRTREDQI